MDISVIILNWNVRDLLRRCLTSIYANTSGISFEVIVVDNASSDASADMVRAEFPQAMLIVNDQNFGFAKGNNIGVREASGDVVLLLNPDTELIGNTLCNLVAFLKRNPDAGLVGAEFLNPDGTHQPSVRRFPTLLDQSLILFKVHKLIPRLGVFKRYLARDLDVSRTQPVEQVSGTFFGMPRRTIEEVGLLDERFFIWFEDVDYCRRVWSSGKKVLYTPEIQIMNRGGASFSQVGTCKKQKMFNKSMAAYYKKWHGIAAWLAIEMLRPISLLLAWAAGRVTIASAFGWTLIGLLATDVVSFLASYDVRATTAIGLVLLATTFVVTIRRPDLGFLVIVAELVHGSQGHLFELYFGSVGIPIRIALFAAFLIGWIVVSTRKLTELTVSLWWYAVVAAVVLGVVVGLARGNSIGAVLADANAYGYMLLLLPALDVMRRSSAAFRDRLMSVIVAAGLATAVLTVVVHLLYALDVSFLRHLYVWIRDWGLGEVTPPGPAAFHRVFFQSHLWTLLSFFTVLVVWRSHRLERGIAGGLLFSAIILSFSRSLWLGAAVGFVVLFVMRWRVLLRTIPIAIPVALLIVALVAPATFERTVGRMSSIVSEPAAASRWSLLPVLWGAVRTNPVVGYGFGTTLTYTTKDPKLIAEFGTDQYTTAAFEWGYLEQWFKMGLLGIVAILGLIVHLCRRILRTPDHETRAWLFSGLVAVAVVHLTSPYLNHPLGLGFLIIAYALSEKRKPIPA